MQNRAIETDPVWNWIVSLARYYPDDIGVLSPIFLNLICLSPGQAMYLPAGRLHAYLEGTGLELMANSDNVLRGGLTPKHVDVPELLTVLRFESTSIDVILPRRMGPYEETYATPATEFLLSRITLVSNDTYKGVGEWVPESSFAPKETFYSPIPRPIKRLKCIGEPR